MLTLTLTLTLTLAALAAKCEALGLKGKTMIIQNKGGGHGTIGYYLAKDLLLKNPEMKVAILQDSAYKKTKEPFASYPELLAMGVEIVECALGEENPDMGSLKDFKPDYVIDNWSKSETNAAFTVDICKSGSATQLVFVSSAGMYNGKVTPLVEADEVKTNAVREVELAFLGAGLPYTFLRPQYIYGPKSNKKYLDYFIGRASRKLPIPIPGPGDQVVALSHIEDVASLVASCVGCDGAMNEIMNCGTDKYTGYTDLCELIHSQMGTTSELVKYDTKEFKKTDFPFRPESFVTDPSKAMKATGWAPKHTMAGDIAVEVANYIASDDKKEWSDEDRKVDLEVIAATA